eukprot:scaffold1172_cov409-Prasinococcus_capsulatus_cf.AAC.3
MPASMKDAHAGSGTGAGGIHNLPFEARQQRAKYSSSRGYRCTQLHHRSTSGRQLRRTRRTPRLLIWKCSLQERRAPIVAQIRCQQVEAGCAANAPSYFVYSPISNALERGMDGTGQVGVEFGRAAVVPGDHVRARHLQSLDIFRAGLSSIWRRPWLSITLRGRAWIEVAFCTHFQT